MMGTPTPRNPVMSLPSMRSSFDLRPRMNRLRKAVAEGFVLERPAAESQSVSEDPCLHTTRRMSGISTRGPYLYNQ